jgi:DNA-directed RNA polymerase subunit K/omega
MSNIKKNHADNTTVTRDLSMLEQSTGNVYESISIIAKRANQISSEIKEELHGKLEEFTTHSDNLEEVFENREQIEISRHYEKMPKPSLLAISEFLDDKVYFRNPTKDSEESN